MLNSTWGIARQVTRPSTLLLARCGSCGRQFLRSRRRNIATAAAEQSKSDAPELGQVESVNRPWVWRDEKAPAPEKSFTVMSYNILADHLARRHTQLYPYCSPEHLGGARRLDIVISELLHWRPDVVCLQEVACFTNILEPLMAREGYIGMFKKRTGDQHLDGCAMFVKTAKFEVSDYSDIEFRVPGDAVLKGDNVAQVAVLKCKRSGGSVSVANTHILYAPARGDVKLLQLKKLFKTVTASRKVEGGRESPAVICGDFNSTPGSMLLSDFVFKGSLSFIHMVGTNRRKLSGQLPASRYQDWSHIAEAGYDYGKEHDISKDGTGNDPSELLVHLGDDAPVPVPAPSRETVTVRHSLQLSSAYDYKHDSTTFHKGFKGVVDYLLYTRDCLRLEGVVQLLPPKVFRHYGGMPNAVHPSDHQPLLACFSLGSDTGFVRSLR